MFKVSLCKAGTLSLATENNDALQSTIDLFRDSYNNEFNEDLAKREGFRDIVTVKSPNVKMKSSAAEQMFKILDKKYDLSSPKTFYVYRFKWKGTD